jgi:hypothetical protein
MLATMKGMRDGTRGDGERVQVEVRRDVVPAALQGRGAGERGAEEGEGGGEVDLSVGEGPFYFDRLFGEG